MDQHTQYPIGTQGKKWEADEKATWLSTQSISRSYQDDVLNKLETLTSTIDVKQYGALSCDPNRYPLYVCQSKHWDNSKPTALITGGVHGYETSGVHGAIRFIETQAHKFCHVFNLVVFPCVSPWGYETINRWNPSAIDPNRSFYNNSPAEESAAVIQYMSVHHQSVTLHIDLHETTNTDNSEFRPALAARDGVINKNWNIPDGFYLVGNTENPVDDFQTAIIESVKKVTHIAPPDDNNRIIGEVITQQGVINYKVKELGLCTSVSNAAFSSITEVYPDSPRVSSEDCIVAQVAAITGGLEYLINNGLAVK